MPVFHLVYRSAARPGLSLRDLEDILIISRIYNLRDAVTGVLIYRDESFLQLLEGGEEAVRATVERIRRDPRNRDIVVLAETESASRLFADWSMGWVGGDASGESAEDLFQLFDQLRNGALFETKASIETMLRQFATHARPLLQ